MISKVNILFLTAYMFLVILFRLISKVIFLLCVSCQAWHFTVSTQFVIRNPIFYWYLCFIRMARSNVVLTILNSIANLMSILNALLIVTFSHDPRHSRGIYCIMGQACIIPVHICPCPVLSAVVLQLFPNTFKFAVLTTLLLLCKAFLFSRR